MPFPGTIYANPVLPHGYYWVKLVDVATRHTGEERPQLRISLELGRMHGEWAGTRLASIIHSGEASRFYYVNFLSAFRIHGTNYYEGLNRWASVEVYPAEWEGTRYSAVKFTYQPLPLRLGALRLERAEAEGRLDEAGLAQTSIG